MKQYQKSLITEHAQLSKRIAALEGFRESEKFRNLPEAEQEMMRSQLLFMEGYHQILNRRIAAWKPQRPCGV